jgi:nicotinamide/nicotinate riboside kinase
VQSDPEGSLWRDPPQYWEQIVWPAYVDAHKSMFVDGDVERGEIDKGFQGRRLLVIEGLDESMDRMVEECCVLVKESVSS